MLTTSVTNLSGYDDNPFSSSQKSFEKMRKMFYLCSALVENGLPFSFAGFQIPTNLGGLFCFCVWPDWVNDQKEVALVENPAIIPKAMVGDEPPLSAGIEVELHCLNCHHLPTQAKIQSMIFFKVVIWLRAGGVCWVALICLFGSGQLTLASFDIVKVLAVPGPNYLFFPFNVMASALLCGDK